MIERIVYVSRAGDGVGREQAYDIMRTSHNRNSREGLTGALLMLDGWFIQVIEGDAVGLAHRYQAISRDTRHTDVQLRDRRPVDARAFPDDWMALRLDTHVPAALLERYSYRAGFPEAQFDADRLLSFARDCCREN